MDGFVVFNIKFILKVSGCSISASRVNGIRTIACLFDGVNVAIMGLESKSIPLPTR